MEHFVIPTNQRVQWISRNQNYSSDLLASDEVCSGSCRLRLRGGFGGDAGTRE